MCLLMLQQRLDMSMAMVFVLTEEEVEIEMLEVVRDMNLLNMVGRTILEIPTTTFMDILLK